MRGGSSTAAEEAFRARFGRAPEVVVSAPGRVNLIGEHTDYSLLPVMPFAIDRRLTVAMAPAGSWEIHASGEPTPFTGRPGEAGWHRYAAAALAQVGALPGAIGTVSSDLPATGGLASSSALTMALIAAFARLVGGSISLDQVVEAAAVAERHAGVESGLMDQVAIAHGREGSVLRVDFSRHGPPQAVSRPWPAGHRVVVAYSGEVAHKGGGARLAYNRAVVACRAATVLIARRAGIEIPVPFALGDVAGLPDVLSMVAELPPAASAADVAAEASIDVDDLIQLTAGRFDPATPLPVRTSARHVLTEAARVDAAWAALAAGDLDGLGRLLDESHASLVDFGASTPSLDRLTIAMRQAGALGSRLTGAGFGGNAVALTTPGRAPDVVAAAIHATRGPAFVVVPDDGLRTVTPRQSAGP